MMRVHNIQKSTNNKLFLNTFKMYSTKNGEANLTQNTTCDMIGKPDPLSNLRPYKFHIPENESPLEKTYRLEREKVQNWNQEFWTKHNNKFIKEREQYTEELKIKLSKEKECTKDEILITADEMSVFYKQFLDKHWYIHMNYNWEWYKRNARLVLLSIRVNLYKLFN